MAIYTLHGKRINIYAPIVLDGNQFANLLHENIRKAAGVVEIEEPAAPDDYSELTYFRMEQDDAPYVVYSRKSDQQIAQASNNLIRAQIATLEAGQDRAVREAIITQDSSRLIAINSEITTLRAQLVKEV